MIRVVVFLSLLIGISVLFSFHEYKKFEVPTTKYVFSEVKKSHLKKMAEREELKKMQSGIHEESEKMESVKVEVPSVVLDTPELKHGSELFKKCIVCHGKIGQGKKAQKAPNIGGQHAWYLKSALMAMKNKTRLNKVMDPYLKKLSDNDLSDLSEYISKLPWKKRK